MPRRKQKRTYYSVEFKQKALERMKVSDNIVRLAEELGIGRPLLYQWEAAADGRGRSQGKRKQRTAPVTGPGEAEAALQQEVSWLREALARKVQETDFFRGALQKVEARRQNNGGSGAAGSTTKSGK